jgi:hypothetical protein
MQIVDGADSSFIFQLNNDFRLLPVIYIVQQRNLYGHI